MVHYLVQVTDFHYYLLLPNVDYKHSLNQYKNYITKNSNVKTKEEFADDVIQAISKLLNKIINE